MVVAIFYHPRFFSTSIHGILFTKKAPEGASFFDLHYFVVDGVSLTIFGSMGMKLCVLVLVMILSGAIRAT